MDNNLILVEAVIYAAGKRGVTRNTILEKSGLTAGELELAIQELKIKYANNGSSGLVLNDYGDLLSISTYSKVSEKVADILMKDKQKELSGVLLETLAIIAYEQPITRSEIENIRGINCDYAINVLSSANLIYVSGIRNAPGNPREYSTTDEFLLKFELKNKFELRNIADIENRLKAMTEVAEEGVLFQMAPTDFEIKFDSSEDLIDVDDDNLGAGESDELDDGDDYVSNPSDTFDFSDEEEEADDGDELPEEPEDY